MNLLRSFFIVCGFFLSSISENTASHLEDPLSEKNPLIQNRIAPIAVRNVLPVNIPCMNEEVRWINEQEVTTNSSKMACAACFDIPTKSNFFNTQFFTLHQRIRNNQSDDNHLEGIRAYCPGRFLEYYQQDDHEYSRMCCVPFGYFTNLKKDGKSEERFFITPLMCYDSNTGFLTPLGGTYNGYGVSPCVIGKCSDDENMCISWGCGFCQSDENGSILWLPGFMYSSLHNKLLNCFFGESKHNCYTPLCCHGDYKHGEWLLTPVLSYMTDDQENPLCCIGPFAKWDKINNSKTSGLCCLPLCGHLETEENNATCIGFLYGHSESKDQQSKTWCLAGIDYFTNNDFLCGLEACGIGCGVPPEDKKTSACEMSFFHKRIPLLSTVINKISTSRFGKAITDCFCPLDTGEHEA